MSFDKNSNAHDINSSTSSDDQSSVSSVIHVTAVNDNGGFSRPSTSHEVRFTPSTSHSKPTSEQLIAPQFERQLPDDSLDSDDSVLLRKVHDESSGSSSEEAEM